MGNNWFDRGVVIVFSIYEQLASQVDINKIKLQEQTPVVTVIEPVRVSTQAASPNKLAIMVVFAFFGAFDISIK